MMKENEKLKTSNLIILSSAASVMHGEDGRPVCTSFHYRGERKSEPAKVSRSRSNIEKTTAAAAAIALDLTLRVFLFFFSPDMLERRKVKWSIQMEEQSVANKPARRFKLGDNQHL